MRCFSGFLSLWVLVLRCVVYVSRVSFVALSLCVLVVVLCVLDSGDFGLLVFGISWCAYFSFHLFSICLLLLLFVLPFTFFSFHSFCFGFSLFFASLITSHCKRYAPGYFLPSSVLTA